jgi:hypothetical protein
MYRAGYFTYFTDKAFFAFHVFDDSQAFMYEIARNRYIQVHVPILYTWPSQHTGNTTFDLF